MVYISYIIWGNNICNLYLCCKGMSLIRSIKISVIPNGIVLLTDIHLLHNTLTSNLIFIKNGKIATNL